VFGVTEGKRTVCRAWGASCSGRQCPCIAPSARGRAQGKPATAFRAATPWGHESPEAARPGRCASSRGGSRPLVLGRPTVEAIVDIPLFSMQFTGIATPSIHAGFGLMPARNPHKINRLLTGPFSASTDTDRSLGAAAGKGSQPPKSRVGADERMTPSARRSGDVCRWCGYRGPRGIRSSVQTAEPLSKQNGYAVRHCEGESDWNAAVGMSRCA